jgi:hypothetical protein
MQSKSDRMSSGGHRGLSAEPTLASTVAHRPRQCAPASRPLEVARRCRAETFRARGVTPVGSSARTRFPPGRSAIPWRVTITPIVGFAAAGRSLADWKPFARAVRSARCHRRAPGWSQWRRAVAVAAASPVTSFRLRQNRHRRRRDTAAAAPKAPSRVSARILPRQNKWAGGLPDHQAALIVLSP